MANTPALAMPPADQLPMEMFVKPAPAKAKPAPPTEEQLAAERAEWKALSAELPHLLFGDPKKEEKKPEEAKKPEEVKKPDEVKPAEAAKPDAPPAEEKPTRRRKAKAEPVIDAVALAAATGDAVAEKLKPVLEAVKPAPAAAPELPATLAPEDQEILNNYKLLEEEYPEKYKGVHARQLGFLKQAAAYQEKWEKAHPDEAWDPDDEQHAAFFAKQPTVSESDISSARSRREARAVVAEERKASDAKYAKIEDDLAAERLRPEAERDALVVTSAFVDRLQDDWKKVIQEKGSKGLEEADPVAYEILNTHLSALQQEVIELKHIVARPGYFKESNPVHYRLAAALNHYESTMQSLPAAEQIWKGLKFATRGAFDKMSKSEQSKHWTLTEKDLIDMRLQDVLAAATTQVTEEKARIEKLATRYGFTRAVAPASGTTQPGSDGKPASAAASAAAPNPPAGGGDGTVAPTTTKPTDVVKSKQEQLKQMLWG